MEAGDPSRDTAVRSTYERIGRHFAETRPYPWEEVERFLHDRAGGIGLDIGVGNGRHAEVLAAKVDRVIGVDLSRALLEAARSRSGDHGFELDLCQATAATLPFRSHTVDLAVYIATLHHLAPRQRRIESLNELARVLTADGLALVSVWSVSHERFQQERGFDTSVDWTLPDGTVVERFYHIYDLEEFRADLERANLRPFESFQSRGNCFAVVGRT